jgi:predicted dehydrogenase
LKVILVGFGSIGKRHLRNIISLGYNDVVVVSPSGKLEDEFSSLKVYKTIEEGLSLSTFDVAIISNPTAVHLTSFQVLLKANIPNIYIEKPISHNYEGIEKILEQLDITKHNIKVGFDLHYDLGLQKVKELIISKTIGNIVSVNAQVGQYLPDWRPHEDYSNGMSAKKETGGGVMLDLVHEFDYLYWLLGNVDTIASFNKNSGSLNIETEDVAEVLLKFDNGIIGTIHLDYLQPKLVRNCMFTGSEGSIFWNLVDSKVKWINKEKQENEFDYKGFERNDRFLNIMRDFLALQTNGKTTSFEQGLQSLRMVLAAKYSSEQNVFVKMKEFNPQ